MIKRVVIRWARLLEALLIIFALLVFILLHPKTLPALVQMSLDPTVVRIGSIEGTLVGEIVVHDLEVPPSIMIKTLKVRLNPWALLHGSVRLSRIDLNGLTYTHKETTADPEEQNSSMPALPEIRIDRFDCRECRLILPETVRFDLQASGLRFRSLKSNAAEELRARVATRWASVSAQGSLKDTTLQAKLGISPKYGELSWPGTLPHPATLAADLRADLQTLELKTDFPEIPLDDTGKQKIAATPLSLRYQIAENRLKLHASTRLEGALHSRLNVQGNINAQGDYSFALLAEDLWAEEFVTIERLPVFVRGNAERMEVVTQTPAMDLTVRSQDYRTFRFEGRIREGILAYGNVTLPDIIVQNPFVADFKGQANIDPLFDLNATLALDSPLIKAKFDAEANALEQRIIALLDPPKQSPLALSAGLEHADLLVFRRDGKTTLHLQANPDLLSESYATLMLDESDLDGWGVLANGDFALKGSLEANATEPIDYTLHTPSLNALLAAYLPEKPLPPFDAQIDANGSLFLDEPIRSTLILQAPWIYWIKNDADVYYATDAKIHATLDPSILQIEEYAINVMEHPLQSRQTSIIRWDAQTLNLRPFWLMERLKATGSYDLQTSNGIFNIAGKSFTYDGDEGNLTADADIDVIIAETGHISAEGYLQLLDGTITYEPSKAFHAKDDDIIVIQEMQPSETSDLFINLRCFSDQPIRYKTDSIDIRFLPDITLWQEPAKPLQLLGMVTLKEGNIKQYEKAFDLEPSVLYFHGDYPVNPYLNLLLKYEVETIFIWMAVTNTLEDPIILFRSDPSMNQEDIISYLLFGASASDTFSQNKSESQSNQMAAVNFIFSNSLRAIFKESAGVQIDTLNLLQNEEGTLGIEVGTRLSSNVRLLYRNDDVSSLVLQTQLNRWLRVDVDVRETGQGVNFLIIRNVDDPFDSDASIKERRNGE